VPCFKKLNSLHAFPISLLQDQKYKRETGQP